MESKQQETSDAEGDALMRELAAVPEIDPAQRALEPGALVAGFRVVRELGRGGMGVVYLADDTKLDRQVALKVLPPSLASDPRRRKMLMREARAAAAVAHGNIASVYELCVADDSVAIALEYVAGSTLRDRLRGGALPLGEALDIADQILDGLGTAHAAGLVHRDLKPENVMVTDEGVVKLLDFGLAQVSPDGTGSRELGSLPTLDGRRGGTPAYMSPEQVVGEALDARSDIFSFGVLLYEMLAGRRPFTGPTVSAIVRAVVSEDEPPLPADIPTALSAVVHRCLAKAPEARPPNARDLAHLLFESRRSPQGPARWRRVATIAAVLLAAGGAIAFAIAKGTSSLSAVESAATSAAPAPEPVRLTDDSVVACPIWQTAGVREPSGWYGAAAADLVCDLVPARLALHSRGALGPAQLLGLPLLPTDNAEDDPFGSPTARTRTLEAAASATVTLDGVVERTTMDVKVTVILRRGDSEIARVEARNEAMPTAIEAALSGLVTSGKLVPAAESLPEDAYPQFTRSPEAAMIVYNLFLRSLFGAETSAYCRRLMAVPGEELYRRAFWPVCGATIPAGATRPGFTLDPTSVESLTYAAGMEAGSFDPAKRGQLREHIQRARGRETAPDLLAALAVAEGKLWALDDDSERMRASALAALKLMPANDTAADLLVQADMGTERAASTARWAETIHAYWLYGIWQTPAERLRQWRRLHELTGLTDPAPAVVLSPLLVASGNIAEAQTLAAELLAGPAQLRGSSEAVFADLAVADASFGGAVDHLLRYIEAKKPTDWDTAELSAINRMLRLSDVLGAQRRTADALFDKHFVGPNAFSYTMPRSTWVWASLLGICIRLSPDRAPRCMDLVDEFRKIDDYNDTVSKTYEFYFTGARAFVKGDKQAAVRAWKRLDPGDTYFPLLVNIATFDEIGATREASAIDLELIRLKAGMFRGASMSYVREATRAQKRGDKKQAAELAAVVIDAWSKADLPVPWLDAMRALH